MVIDVSQLIWVYLSVGIVGIISTYIGAYLRKKGENLATHEDVDRLVAQVSAVTQVTKQIEAKVEKSSKVYERQLDILQGVYSKLYDVLAVLQRMTSGGRMSHELPPSDYAPHVVTAMRAAFEEFQKGRLLLPSALVHQCDTFFSTVYDGQRDFAFAVDPMVNPQARTTFIDSANNIAHRQVPEILKQIEDAARTLIHGDRD